MSLSDRVVNEGSARVQRLAVLVGRLDGFQVFGAADPRVARDAVVQEILTERDWWVTEATPWLRADLIDVAKARTEAATEAAEFVRLKTEAAAIVADLQEAAAQRSSTDLSSHYVSQGKRAMWQAIAFGVAGAASLSVLVAMTVAYIGNPAPYDANSPNAALDLIRADGPRLIQFALVAYVLRFAIRGYGIARNEQAVSAQKRMALDTFNLLRDSVRDDPAAKREVTTELVHAVFGVNDTGYLKGNESASLNALSGITTVIKNPGPGQ